MSTIIDAPTGDSLALDPTVRIRNLQHYYGEGELRKQVLFDNNLVVDAGEIVIMTGPSGSGKTTLLTLIGTLRTVQEGSLEVLGRELLGASPKELTKARLKIGFIFQEHNLFESLTAVQNVRMALEPFGIYGAEAEKRTVALLTTLGLEQRVHYKPDSLSGGQKQRVAIARGLVHKPRLILADEPTAALDKQSGRDVVTLFQKYARQERCSILMVTHDNRILDVADRIVSMVDGQIKSSVIVQVSAEICRFLRQTRLFPDLTPRTLTQVADQMKLEKHPPGTAIIREGDPGDKFYLIKLGTVDVLVTENGVTQSVAKRRRGEYFGERALILDQPRAATVVASEYVELYTLARDQFQAVRAASTSFQEELRKALFDRQ